MSDGSEKECPGGLIQLPGGGYAYIIEPGDIILKKVAGNIGMVRPRPRPPTQCYCFCHCNCICYCNCNCACDCWCPNGACIAAVPPPTTPQGPGGGRSIQERLEQLEVKFGEIADILKSMKESK